jgi:hypothetical protein
MRALARLIQLNYTLSTPVLYTPTINVEITPYGCLYGYVCNIYDTAGAHNIIIMPICLCIMARLQAQKHIMTMLMIFV